MAGVFLSYDRDDTDRARPLAAALEKAGHSVWWDLHVRGGAQFGKVIEEALKAADAIVVLWSKHSVESAWVKDEAGVGRDTGRLLPVTIDGTVPPLGFRQFQTLNLSRWSGRGKPAEFQTLLLSLEAFEPSSGDGETHRQEHQQQRPASGRDLRKWRLIAAAAALLIIIVGASFALWRSWDRPGLAVVAVRAADENGASQDLARDLLVQLGELRPILANSMRLLTSASGQSDRADLLFQAAAINGGNGASLILSDSGDEILWSKQFDDPEVSGPDRRQQMAFTAARVLRCALQEMSGKYGRLQSDARQLFLDACAASADLGWDMRSVVQPLRKVIAAAPNFRPAWAQLLIADINVASFMADSPTSEQWKSALRSDLLAAQKRFPDMAEVTVAEYEANSNSTFSDSVALLDKAKSQDPDNVFVLSQHAIIMASVGRVADSVDDEQRAAQLDPLSPAVRSEYIRMLAYAGQLAAARAELARAKQLWPGADSVQQAESSLELRYGDFEKAIRQSPDYSGPGVELYIAARKNPDDANVAAVFNYLTKSGLNSGRLSMGVQALGEMNRVDDVFRLIASAPRGTLKDPYVLFRPWLAEARRDPRFMTVAKSLGLLEYWKTSGHWPDFCSDPGLKYDCKKEAARLGA